MSDNETKSTRKAANTQINQRLLRSAIKVNTWLVAGVTGSVAGLALFLLTYLSLFRGLPEPGHYLNLLGVFLPGYSVSLSGAWIGLLWGALIGAFLGGMFYRIYAQSIEARIDRYLEGEGATGDLMATTLRISGNYLGLALGGIVAAGLIVTTSWLVIRGTADQSMHAILLANYLPGYSVSFTGALIGGVELFLFMYVISLVYSWIYNAVAFAGDGRSS